MHATGATVGTPLIVNTEISSSSLQINSNDDLVQVSHSDDIAVGGEDFAVSFWFKLEQGFTGQWRSIVHKGVTNGERTFALWMQPNDNRVRFAISTAVNSNDGGTSIQQIPVNQWSHISYVKEGNQLKLYINGRLDAMDVLDGEVIANTGDLYIGSSPWYNPAMATYADVHIYQRVISSLEAKSLYQAKFSGFNIEEQIVANGSPEWISGSNIEGQAIQINSNDDVGIVPHSINFPADTRDFTVGFWMRLDQGFTGQWRTVMHKGNTAQERTFAMWMHPSSNRFHFRISTTGSWNDGGNSVSQIPVGEWTHITYVKQGNQLHLYINGQLDASDTLGGDIVANNGPLYIGSSPWNNPAFATYDRITAFKRGIQAEAVARLYAGTTDNNAHRVGQWGELIPWPHVAVSAANLPDGRILTWSGSERTIWPRDEQTYSSTWNPETNEFLEVFHEGHNMFCAHLAMSEDGQVFVTGGRNQLNSPWASLFNYRDNQWNQIENMATGGRWYPVTLALPSGELMTSMGTATNFSNPEKWSVDNGWQVLNNVDYSAMRTTNDGTSGARRWWANLSVAPSGEVFHFWSAQENHLINTEGTGLYKDANASTNDVGVAPGVNIQYDAGKMLVTGGNQGSWGGAATRDQAFTVDLNGPAPVIATAERMNFSRVFHNLIPMPDGTVLAIGGNTSGRGFNDTGTVYEAEIWNPQTRDWSSAASMAAPRNYHSIGLLLTDGRVLSAGGGYCSGNEFCNGASHQSGQIYSPPYLFNEDGSLADRPLINSAPGVIRAGETISLNGSNDITNFSLIKMSSTTHAVNTDARFNRVDFQKTGDQQFELTPNSNPNILIPGYWMLFALNDQGVPSEAHVVRVERAVDITTPGPNRYIKFEANSEVNGNPWSSVAELNVLDGNNELIDRARWQITSDSEEPDGLAEFAIDDNPNTIWHTEWREFAGINNDPSHPHELVIDLRGSYIINGISYLPRQDMPNGRVANYTVYLSSDGKNWTPVSQGVFGNDANLKTIDFNTPLQQITLDQPEPSASSSEFAFSATDIEGLEYKWSFGDGSPETAFQSSSTANHIYAAPGRYIVVLTIRNPVTGQETSITTTKIVYDSAINTSQPERWLSSSSIHFHPTNNQVWNVNPDNNTVTVIDSNNFAKVAEITVGEQPSALAFSENGNVWVTNKKSDSVTVINANTLTVLQTISLPDPVSKPHGIVIENNHAYIVLEGLGEMLKISTQTNQVIDTVLTSNHSRHIAKSVNGAELFVTSFITPLVRDEHTDTPDASDGVESIFVFNDTTLQRTINMQHSNVEATENSGPGIPNYLGAMAIHPAGHSAYVPSKQDNILSGSIRNGIELSFDQAVRAISSRIDLTIYQETLADRIDHDNASFSSAAVYGPYGIHLFTALEGNRQVAVSNTTTDSEILRFNVGRAPQGLALSPDGKTLVVHNFMERSVEFVDISNIVDAGGNDVSSLASVDVVNNELLSADVLKGKQLFYDSADDRLAALDYMSCASCHNDGSHDGRVWDFTQFGEGIRNTTSLRGKSGTGHGLLHWTGNFDEVQDFEGQIRGFAGGTGLMDSADFFNGTRQEPLGDSKTGFSEDLDALAIYLESLSEADVSPLYSASGLSPQAQQGREIFNQKGCVSCHTDSVFTDSPNGFRHDVGTLTTASGERLSGFLDGLDTPTLLGLWSSAPYLHDGSAATVEQAIVSHIATSLTQIELQAVTRYLHELPHDDIPTEPEIAMQSGRIENAQSNKNAWYNVTFDEAFDGVPVVVAGPVSFAGGQPTTVRLRNITPTGFEIQMDEWDYLDGGHLKETIDYIAVLPGNHVIGGLKVEAKIVTMNHQWQRINFSQGFTQVPVVLGQIASYEETQSAITRVRGVTTSKIDMRIDEEEANDRQHVPEQVHIIAIEPGKGSVDGQTLLVGKTGNDVDHRWTSIEFSESVSSPLLISNMQTTNGGDPATVRYRNLQNNKVDMHIDEEQSANREVGHVKESVGWVLFSR